MKLKNIFAVLSFGLLIYSCKQQDKNCDLQYVDLSKKTYKIKGCLNQSSHEDGRWEVYDTANVLIEQGAYSDGIKTGLWQYPQTNNLSLNWSKYAYEKIGLVTNILSNFTVIASDSNSVKLSNKDSSKLINIVIAIHDLASTNIDPEEYHLQGENEITQRGWHFQQNRTDLILKDRKAYFNEYKVTADSGSIDREFYLSNVYSVISDGKLMEIMCRYTEKGGLEARKLFFAVMTNSFINGKRFFNPFEPIVNIIERQN
jgi:hypothetical protein